MYIGEIAAILTAVCWSINSILFSDAGKKIGSQSVNHLRLWGALFFLTLLQLIVYQKLIPDLSVTGYVYLAISGVIGFFIGDALLFESYVLIGPRMAMLMMTAVPIFSVLLGWLFLKETLNISQLSAIGVTTVAIGFVIKDNNNNNRKNSKHLLKGILFGLGGALGQAIGLLFSKRGMLEGTNPISANLVRAFAATIAMSLFLLIKQKFFKDFSKLKEKGIKLRIISGSIFGPVIGVILSLVAILHIHMGIASTLMSLSPVILIPISRILYKEQFTFKTILWTIIAIVGASWLFFV